MELRSSGYCLMAALALLLSACASNPAGTSPATASTSPATASSPSPSHTVTPSSTGTSSKTGASSPLARADGPPRLQHLIVVVEENHSYADIIGNHDAPFLNSLAESGASLTKSYAVAHPSEPNYLALFSGSTQGLTDDSCPHRYAGPDLAGELLAAHRRFAGYAEDLPAVGYAGCSFGLYARKHAPWTDFADVPSAASKPLSAFPSDYSALPTVSFVIPNLDHDMHNGTIAAADTWLATHLSGYLRWASGHDSALLVTWDEDDFSQDNQIPTLVAGAHVRRVHDSRRVDQYTVLRTIEWLFGLPPIARAAQRAPITTIWAED